MGEVSLSDLKYRFYPWNNCFEIKVLLEGKIKGHIITMCLLPITNDEPKLLLLQLF